MSNETVIDTCSCGAKLAYSGYVSFVRERHDAWLAAHQTCRRPRMQPPMDDALYQANKAAVMDEVHRSSEIIRDRSGATA